MAGSQLRREGIGAALKRHVSALAAISLLVTGLVAVQITAAQADISTTSFSQRYSATALGSLVSIGNTLLTCNPNVPPVSPIADTSVTCAQIQNSSGTGAANNDNFAMIYLDQDSDSSTNNSSMSALNLPDNYSVLWAGLYWGARTDAGTQGAAPAGNTNEKTMLLKAPGDAAYRTITANKTWDKTSGQNGMAPSVSSSFGNPYQSFADVTNIVQGAGNGTYWGANVAAATGADRYAGWALTVVYEAPTLPMAKIVVYDGFDFVGGYNGQNYTSTITLPTPTPQGEDSPYAQFSLIAYDGDRVGSMSQVGAHYNSANITLSNPLSSASYFASTNEYNGSSISGAAGAAPTGWRTPAPLNQLGFDVNNNQVTNLQGGLTATPLELTDPSGSSFWPGMIGVATYLGGSIFTQSTKTVQNLNNNSPAQPGDILRYTFNYSNTGDSYAADTAKNAVSTDQIPAGTTYVPGSLNWISPWANGASWGFTPVTDAKDGDAGYFDSANNQVVMDLCSSATQAGPCDLAPYAPFQYSFEVKVTGSGAINNTACLSWTDAQRTYLNDDGKVDGQPVQVGCWELGSEPIQAGNVTGTDLGVTKAFNPAGSVVAGSPLSATITVTNNAAGANPATNVVVTDTPPAGWTITSVTPPAGWTCSTPSATGAATPISCTTPSLAAGATATITMSGSTSASDTTTSSLSNTASVSATESDTNPTNNTASASVSMTRSADLQVTKTAQTVASSVPGCPDAGLNNGFVPGCPVEWTISTYNAGPSNAMQVAINDTLSQVTVGGNKVWPASFGTPTIAVSGSGTSVAQCPTGSQSTHSAACAVDVLAVGQTATVTVPGTLATNLTVGTVIANTGQASAATPDSNTANNSIGTDPQPTMAEPWADLVVTKTTPRTSVTAGRQISWTVTVTNNGPADSTNVSFNDIIASQVSNVAVSPSRGICTTSPQIDPDTNAVSTAIECTAGTLAAPTGGSAGQAVTYTITGTVVPGFAGTIANYASAESGDASNCDTDATCTPDPNIANNINVSATTSAGADGTVTVTPVYNLSVQKTASQAELPSAGEVVDYQILVTNNGPSVATHVTLTDLLPTALLQPNSDDTVNTPAITVTDASGNVVFADGANTDSSFNGGYPLCTGSNGGPIPASDGIMDDDSTPIAGQMDQGSDPTYGTPVSPTVALTCTLDTGALNPDGTAASGIPVKETWTIDVSMTSTQDLNAVADPDNDGASNGYAVVNTATVPNSNGTTASDTATLSGIESVDLSIVKQGPPADQAVAGQSGWYTLTVTNNSTDTTSEQQLVIDALPAGLSYTGPQFDPSNAAATGLNPSAWPLPDPMPAGMANPAIIVTPSQEANPIVGCTTFTTDGTNATPDNGVAPAYSPSAAVNLQQVVECGFYDANGEPLPLAPGSSVQFPLPVYGSPALPDGEQVTNEAGVEGSQADLMMGNNTSQVTMTVLAQADVQTLLNSQAPGGNQAPAGTTRDVTFTIANAGPSNAVGVGFTIQRTFAAYADGAMRFLDSNSNAIQVYESCTNYPEELQCALYSDAALTQPYTLAPGTSITVVHPVIPDGSDAAGTYPEQVFSYSATSDPELITNGDPDANNYKTINVIITAAKTSLLVTKTALDTTQNPWITGTDAPGYIAGNVFVYQITAEVNQNADNRADAENVVVTDALPPGFTAQSASWAGGACSITPSSQPVPVTINAPANSGDFDPRPGYTDPANSLANASYSTVNCDLGTLPGYTGGNSNQVVITISGTIDPLANTYYENADGTNGTEYAHQVPNFAYATSATPSGMYNQATAWGAAYVDLFQQADLRIVKTPDVASLNAGGQLGYTFTVINEGPSAVTNAVITDVLPAGLTIDLTNSANAACQAPLDPADAPAGTATVSPVANGLTLAPLTNWGWNNDGTPSATATAPTAQFACGIPTIGAGDSVPMHLVVSTSAELATGTVINNSATVGASAYDPDLSNNTAGSGNVTLTASADLSVKFLASRNVATIAAGSSFTYTAVGTNSGPSDALNTKPSIVLPAGFIPTSITAPGNTCTWNTVNPSTGTLTPATTAPDGSANVTFDGPMPVYNSDGTIATPAQPGWSTTNAPTAATPYNAATQWALTCTQDTGGAPVAEWPPGMAATAQVTVFVPADTPQQAFTATAQMTSATTDPNPTNNAATATVTVQRSSDVQITKSLVAPNPLQVGSPVTYHFSVTNNGPSKADTVTVSDSVPWGMTYVSSAITAGQLNGQTCPNPTNSGAGNAVLNCNLGTLAVGQSAALNVTFQVINDPTLVGSDGTSNTGTSQYLTPYTNAAGANVLGLCNTGYASSTSQDTNTTNDSSSACGTVSQPPGADMGITKTMTASPVPVDGAAVSSTITVTNNGPQAISSTTASPQSVRVSDAIPVGWLNVTLDPSNTADVLGACSVTGSVPQTLACTWPSFAVGQAKTIKLIGTTASSSTATSLTNTATVTSTWYDPNPANNTATATLTLGQAANLVTQKVAMPLGTVCSADTIANPPALLNTDGNALTAGEDVQWCISVNNQGPSDAQSVRINDVLTMLPNGSSPATMTALDPEYNQSPITVVDQGGADITTATTPTAIGATCSAPASRGQACSVKTLPAGATAFVTVQGTLATNLTEGTAVTNTATATSNTNNPAGNNTSSTTFNVAAPQADVRVTKTTRRTAVTSGNNVSWTVTVTNYGPSDAQNISFTDVIASQVKNVTVTPGAGAPPCNPLVVDADGTHVNCPAGTLYANSEGEQPPATLLAGASVTYTIRGTVDPSFNGTIDNYASAVSGLGTDNCANDATCTQDPEPDNNLNIQAATITVTPSTDLFLTKTASRTALPGVDAPGTVPVKYYVTITNPGPSTALNVPFTDNLPQALIQPFSDGSPNTPTGSVTYYDATGAEISTQSLNDAGCFPASSGDATYDPAPSVEAMSGISPMTCTLGVATGSPNNDGTYLGGIPAGGSVVIEIDMTSTVNLVAVANANPDANFAVTNTASVNAASDPNSANNTGSWTLSGAPQIDLGITKTLAAPATSSLTAGSEATYNLTVTDAPSCVDGSAPTLADGTTVWTFASGQKAFCFDSQGDVIAPYAAETPTVTDNLPMGVTFVSAQLIGVSNAANPANTSAAGQDVACSVSTPATETAGDVVTCETANNMTGGDALTFALTVAIDPSLDPDDVGGAIVNNASVLSGDPETNPDPSMSNNTAQTTTPLTAVADVAGTFTVTMLDGSSDNPASSAYVGDYNGPGSARVGMFTLTNNGPSTAQGVNFTLTRTVDVVAGLNRVVFIAEDGATVAGEYSIDLSRYCVVNVQELQCSLPSTIEAANLLDGGDDTVDFGTILPGHSIVLEYGAIIPGYDVPGSYTDTLNVASATADPNMANNTSSGTITIGAPKSALEVTKSALDTATNPGNTQCADLPADAAGCPNVLGDGSHQSWNAGGQFTYQIVVQVPSAQQFVFDANGQPLLDASGEPVMVNNPPAAPVGMAILNEFGGIADVVPVSQLGPVPDDGNTYIPTSPVVDQSGNGNYADAATVMLSDPLPVGFKATSVSTTAGTCSIGTGDQVAYSTDSVSGSSDAPAQAWTTSLVTCALGTVHGYTGNTTYAGADGILGNTDDVTLPDMGEPVTVTISGTIDPNANDMYPGGDAWAEQVPNTATATSSTPDGTDAELPAVPTNSVGEQSSQSSTVSSLRTLAPAIASLSESELSVLSAQSASETAVQGIGADPATGKASAWGQVAVDIVEQADLQLIKTPDAATASAGDTVGFTLKVINAGPSGLEHVVVTDQLPAGFTVDLTDPANASCVAPTEITSDGSNQWNVSPTVDGNVISIPTNSGVEPDETTTDTSATTIYNSPPTAATAIACVGGSPAQDASGTLVPTPILAAGQTASIHLVANIAPDYAANGTTLATNTAAVGSHAVDTTCSAAPGYPTYGVVSGAECGNNLASADVQVSAASDLAVTIVPPSQTVNDGEAVTVSAQVSDNGPSAAVNVHGIVTFPPGFVPETVTVPTMDGNAMVQCEWNDSSPYAGAPDGGALSIATTGGTWVSANGTDDDNDNADYYESLTYDPSRQYSMTCNQISDGDTTPVWPVGAEGAISATLWVPPNTPAGVYGGTDAGDPAGITASVQAEGQDATASTQCPNSTNQCLIAPDGSIDPDASNNLAAGSITVLSSDTVDVGLTMTTAPNTGVPGDGVVYQYVLTATNLNASDNKIPAQGVTVTDTLPAGVSFDSTSNSDSCTAAPNADGTTTVTCTLGTIDQGDDASATIGVKFAANLTGSVENTATVAVAANSIYQDVNPDNNTASASTTMAPESDLGVTITPNSQDANPGDQVTWTVLLTNDGPSDALNPLLDVTLANATDADGNPIPMTGATLTAASVVEALDPTPAATGIGTCSVVGADESATITCSGWDALPVGGSISVTVTGTLAADLPGGTVINLTAAGSSDTPDVDSTDNDAAAIVTVKPSAQVSIDQVLAPDPVDVGDALTATLTVANAGPSGAANTVVTDTIPAGWTDVSVDLSNAPAGATCTVTRAGTTAVEPSSVVEPVETTTTLQPGDTLTCALGTLPSNADATITLSGTVDPAYAAAAISNTATVTSDTPDLGATDSDTKTVQVGVTQVADLAVSASVTTPTTGSSAAPVTTATANPSDSVTYTYTLTNNGPSVAVNPMLASQLPSADQFAFSDASVVDSGTATGTGTCTVIAPVDNTTGPMLSCSGWDSLPSGATITVQVTGTVASTLPGGTVITSTATGASDTKESDSENNAASASVTVLPSAALGIAQTLAPDPVTAGGTLTTALTVTNSGPSDAVGTIITDKTPTGLQDVSVESVTVVEADGTSTSLADDTCSVVGRNVTCQLGTLPAGATATVTLSGTVAKNSAGSTLTNTATATATTPDLGGPNTATTTESVTVEAAPTPPSEPKECRWDATLLASDPDCVKPTTPTEPKECRWDATLTADDPACVKPTTPSEPKECRWDATLTADDPACVKPTPPSEPKECRWDETLTADDPACVKPTTPTEPKECRWDATLTADDPACVKPTTPTEPKQCRWDANLLADDPACVKPTTPTEPKQCRWDATLTADDPACVKPTTPTEPKQCRWDATLTADDPACVKPTTPTEPKQCRWDATLTADDPACVKPTTPSEPKQCRWDATLTADDPACVKPSTPVKAADLTVTNTVNPGAANPNEPATWQITVTNNGNAPAENPVLTDVLADSSLATISSATVTASNAEGTGACAVSGAATVKCKGWTSLPANGQITVAVTGTVNGGASGGKQIVNTAFVTSKTPDPNLSNNAANAKLLVLPSADLSVAGSVSPETPAAGEPITWTLVVSNDGPSTANDVLLSDALAAFDSITSVEVIGWKGDGSTPPSCTLTGKTLTPDTDSPLHVTTTPENTDGQPVLPSDSRDATIDVPKLASVAETPADSRPTQPVIKDGAQGDQAAAPSSPVVSLNDESESGNTTGDRTAPAGQPTESEPGKPALQNQEPDGAKSANDARKDDDGAESANDEGQDADDTKSVNDEDYDPDAAESAPDEVQSDITLAAAGADLAAAGAGLAAIGETRELVYDGISGTPVFTTSAYTWATSANWTASARNVFAGLFAKPTLPTRALGVNPSEPIPGCNCTLGSMPAGSSFTVVITGILADLPEGGQALLNATVSSSTPDHNQSNNTTMQTETVESSDVFVTNTVTPASAQPGAPVTWDITVGNNGEHAAEPVLLTDMLADPSLATIDAVEVVPDSSTSAAVTCSDPTGGSVACLSPELAAGSAFSVKVFGTLASDLPADTLVTNNAHVSTLTADSDPSNNDSEQSLTVVQVTLTCDAPTILNAAGDQCVNPPLTCTAPQVLNAAGDQCVNPPLTCTAPQVLNAAGDECVNPPLTCTAPQVLNAAGDQCVNPPLTCTAPQVLNAAGDQCVDPPLTCTAPQVLNAAGDQCVNPSSGDGGNKGGTGSGGGQGSGTGGGQGTNVGSGTGGGADQGNGAQGGINGSSGQGSGGGSNGIGKDNKAGSGSRGKAGGGQNLTVPKANSAQKQTAQKPVDTSGVPSRIGLNLTGVNLLLLLSAVGTVTTGGALLKRRSSKQ